MHAMLPNNTEYSVTTTNLVLSCYSNFHRHIIQILRWLTKLILRPSNSLVEESGSNDNCGADIQSPRKVEWKRSSYHPKGPFFSYITVKYGDAFANCRKSSIYFVNERCALEGIHGCYCGKLDDLGTVVKGKLSAKQDYSSVCID